jgi:hypothetical protein
MRRVILKPGETFSNKHLKRKSAFNAKALAAATNIVEDVRERGDEALREYTEKFDGVKIENFRVSQEAIDEAIARCPEELARALEHAAAQIREYHERQLEQSWFETRPNGAIVGAQVRPVDSVGIYVPGGRALYPSTPAHECDSRVGRRRVPHRRRQSAHQGRLARPGRAQGRAAVRRDRDLLGRRRAGHRRARLRHRPDPGRRQDHRPGQRVRRRHQEARLGRCGHRHDRRSFRGVRRGR